MVKITTCILIVHTVYMVRFVTILVCVAGPPRGVLTDPKAKKLKARVCFLVAEVSRGQMSIQWQCRFGISNDNEITIFTSEPALTYNYSIVLSDKWLKIQILYFVF